MPRPEGLQLKYGFSDLQTIVPDTLSSRKAAAAAFTALDQRKAAAEAKDAAADGQVKERLLQELEARKLDLLVQTLGRPELQKAIDAGELTLALIKPHADKGKGLPQDDDEATKVLLEKLKAEKGVRALAINFKFNQASAGSFYEPNKPKWKPEIWDQVTTNMADDATTVVLMHVDKNVTGMEAVPYWRRLMGATNPKEATPESYRGKYATSIDANMFHGSDSKENVKREMGVVRNRLAELLENPSKGNVRVRTKAA